MSKIKLICLDLDGTLIDNTDQSNLYVPQENINAIQKAVKHGIHICLATSRGRISTLKIAHEVGIEDQFMITYNGAIILKGNEKLFESEFGGESLQRILKIIKENNSVDPIKYLIEYFLFYVF